MMISMNRICAFLLTSVLLLFVAIPCAQKVFSIESSDIIFADDFEDKTDWVSLAGYGWTSSNGGPITIGTKETNKYLNIATPWGTSLVKAFETPQTGLIDIKMDIALNYPSISHFGFYDANEATKNLLYFYKDNNSGVNKMIFAPTWSDLSFEFNDNEWVSMEMQIDAGGNKCSVWMTKQGGSKEAVFLNKNINLSGVLKGIVFNYPMYWPNSDGNNFKLDNVMIYKMGLKTGIDDNFNSYSTISDMHIGWAYPNSDNLSIVDGALEIKNNATITNNHNAYKTETLSFSGDIKYPLLLTENDRISFSVVSCENVSEIVNCNGNKFINAQKYDQLEEGTYFHFDVTIDSITSDYEIKIDNEKFYQGTLSKDISLGVNKIIIETVGSAVWYVDNLKSQPSLSMEQWQELQADFDAVDISIDDNDTIVELPSVGSNGSSIVWETSDISCINVSDGSISRPSWEVGPKEVVLTCKVTKYDATLTKSFSVPMLPEVKSILVNGDFEKTSANGGMEGWFATSAAALNISNHSQNGNKSLLITGRGDSTHSAAQNIALKPDRNYHISGYVQLAETKEGENGRISVWMQGGAINSSVGENTNYVTSFDTFYMNTTEWTHIYSDFNTFVNPQVWPATVYIYPFPVGSKTLSFYMDNFELYEYVLKSLSIKGDSKVTVANNGETKTRFLPEASNQFGTKTGVENLKYEWTILENPEGISIDNNGDLNVSGYAKNQVITIQCKAKEGTVAGSSWVNATKTVEVVNNASSKPTVYNLSISGVVLDGGTIAAGYQYFQKDGIEEGSSNIQWYMSDAFDGVYSIIENQNVNTLKIDSILAEKYIKFSVLPKTVFGDVGSQVNSGIITKPRVPIANDVAIKGNAVVGKKITGEYSFLDYNGDLEGVSKFRWLISDTEDGTYSPIEDTSKIDLTINESMANKYIKFEVVPVSQNAPQAGKAYFSKFLIGPTVPVVSNVTIVGKARENEILSVKYTYFDMNNDVEKESVIKWYRSDGALLQTSPTFVTTSIESGETIYAEVTPVSEDFPYQGVPLKSQGIKIVKSETVFSGNASGGSSGGSVNSPVILPTNQYIKDDSKTDDVITTFQDVQGHWAETDINTLAKLGILKGKTNEFFATEDNITRAEFIAVIMRCIHEEGTSYSGSFQDINANDWYANEIQSALDHNIISASDYFRPNDFIKREEIAKIIAQTYRLMMNGQWPISYDLSYFTDIDSISDWAHGYIGGCLELGLLKGTSENTLSATAYATRAQSAAIINRLINAVY